MKLAKYKYLLAVSDFISFLFSFAVAQQLTFLLLGRWSYHLELEENILSLLVYLTNSVILIFIFQSNNLYKLNVFLTRAAQLTAIIKSIFYGLMVLIIISFSIKFPFIADSRLYVFAFSVSSIFTIAVIRILLLRNLYLSKNTLFDRRVLIIGGGKTGSLVACKLMFESYYGIKIIGFIDDAIEKGEIIVNNLKVLGSVAELKRIINENKIDEAIIAIDNIDYERLLEIVDTCNELELNVKISSELFHIIPQKLIIETYSGIPVIDASPRLDKKISLVFKRISDVVLSVVGMILLLPLLLLVSALIKISSKGPVLYTHIRIGKDGKPFKFYKFRSMTVIDGGRDKEREKMMLDFMKNGRPNNKKDTKVIDNTRVTWIGNLLRKTSIDELPQLINVIIGDMSLVGPRPCLPYEYENYDDWQKRRLKVLPGCTGLWQVSGRSEVSFKDSVVLDIYYINNMSPWLDLQLILKTVPVMLFARGGK
mgnify:CR=1 FL=1